MNPEKQPKKKVEYDSGTEKALSRYRKQPAELNLRLALRDKKGEIYVIAALIYQREAHVKLTLESVVLRFNRDNGTVTLPAYMVRSQIDTGQLTYDPRYDDDRPTVRITNYKDSIVMETIDP
jgi:hypothetical protein